MKPAFTPAKQFSCGPPDTASLTELIISDMADYQLRQALTAWDGDTASLLAEMKRRAGVSTDSALASFMGVAQSTVAYWRSRSRVPEAAVLKFERKLEAAVAEPIASRALGARMVAFRLAEFWYQRARENGALGGRAIFYGSVALGFHSITDIIYGQLETYEFETGRDPFEIAGMLLDDDEFLSRVLEAAKSVSAAESFAREARAGLSLPAEKSPQSSPQSGPEDDGSQ